MKLLSRILLSASLAAMFCGAARAQDAAAEAPKPHYWRFQFFMRLNAAPFQREVSAYLPPTAPSQEILSLRRYSPDFNYAEEREPENLKGNWVSKTGLNDTAWIIYDVVARTTGSEKPKKLLPPIAEPPAGPAYSLSPSWQPLIDEKIVQLGLKDKKLSKQVRILFDYVSNSLETAAESHAGDVAKILESNTADAEDRNAIFLAFLSRLGVPARRVNGILLEDRKLKRKTHQWVQGYFGAEWVNFDLAHAAFGRIPADHFVLYYGDSAPIKVSKGIDAQPHFVISKLSEENAMDPGDLVIPQKDLIAEDDYFKNQGSKESFVNNAVGRIAIITEDSISDTIVEKISKQAGEGQTKVYFYSAPYESHFFRGTYIAKILTQNFETLKGTDAIFIQSEDDAGLYALFRMAQNGKKLKKTTIFLNGEFSGPVGDILGYSLFKLIKPKDLFIVREKLGVERAWDMLQEHVIDGRPFVEVAARWNIPFQDVSTQKMDNLPAWRQFLIKTWILAAKSEVNLESIYLILVLPIIALVIVVFRNIIGLETFGTFSPVIVSVAFLTTGAFWGGLIFAIIVATGVLFRLLFHRIHIHLVARMAMLIAVVGLTMLAIIIIGVHWGWGALVNVSILPMVIMAGIVENFTKTQMELGTKHALKLTVYTLLVSVTSYVLIDTAGIQSLVLVFPEFVLVAILLEILIGRWNGIRLFEYLRFYKIVGPGAPAAESKAVGS